MSRTRLIISFTILGVCFFIGALHADPVTMIVNAIGVMVAGYQWDTAL